MAMAPIFQRFRRLLALKIIAGTFVGTGAMPCVGMITLREYLDEVKHLKIKTYEF